MFQSCLIVMRNGFFHVTRDMHFLKKSLTITNTLGLYASFMDIHHNTSLRFIFEDDSISPTSRACIHFCLGKGVGLWLVVRLYIRSFRITHSIFTSTLRFCLGLIQPLAFSLFMCECEHRLDTFDTHLIHCLFGSQHITTHDTIRNVMYALA